MAVVLKFGTAQSSLEYWSIVMSKYCLPCIAFGKGPTLFIATKSSGPDAGKSCIFLPVVVLWAVTFAAWVCVYTVIDLSSRVEPENVATKSVIYVFLTWVSCHYCEI